MSDIHICNFSVLRECYAVWPHQHICHHAHMSRVRVKPIYLARKQRYWMKAQVGTETNPMLSTKDRQGEKPELEICKEKLSICRIILDVV